MVINLNRYSTRIAIIHNIPKLFFRNIEAAVSFGPHLFPAWSNTVFSATQMNRKFEQVYNKYKAIRTKRNRDKIIDAFNSVNQIEILCSNTSGLIAHELNDLPASIRKELDRLYEYLYNTAINYHEFQTYISDTVKDSIDRFIEVNELEVCPLCGLEGFLNLDGQARIALDHWLCRELFPMTAVNFKNLFPIGPSCNGRPAKGETNVLIDNAIDKNRVVAYYPYATNSGISTSFSFVNEPTIRSYGNIPDADWNFEFNPVNHAEVEIFSSWNSMLNITDRYLDFARKNILKMWEGRYKRFIDKHPTLVHAQNISEFKSHLEQWKATFDIKAVAGSVVYIPFIDYLINKASDKYLFGLCENFKR